MVFGITGNPRSSLLWTPVSDLIVWLQENALTCRVDGAIVDGLAERGLASDDADGVCRSNDIGGESDVVLSFGGDGTLLRTAHTVGDHGTPILGVNIGKLGFLADVETEQLHLAVRRLLEGDYRIEARSVLQGTIGDNGDRHFALNDFVITRTRSTHMIAVRVTVDGRFLNTYWSDGLIIATATGSTAYSLSVGGPIVEPGSGVFAITPIAPHTLTVRPIIVPDTSLIEVRVTSDAPYSISADGVGQVLNEEAPIRVRKADRTVNLVKFHDQEYFQTLRSKLMWGAGKRQ